MRFVFNFIFFGLLFYIIFHYFPDAFNTLVSWAEAVYNFLQNIVMSVVNKAQESFQKSGGTQEAFLLPFIALTSLLRK